MLAITNEDDVQTLQNNLKTIYKWQQVNNMQFNENKFELLQYGKNLDIKDSTSYFGPNSRKIERTQCVKDLGVKMSDTQFHLTYRYNMYQSPAKMWVDHKNFPFQGYAHHENTMVQHSPTTHRLLLPAMDTT